METVRHGCIVDIRGIQRVLSVDDIATLATVAGRVAGSWAQADTA